MKNIVLFQWLVSGSKHREKLSKRKMKASRRCIALTKRLVTRRKLLQIAILLSAVGLFTPRRPRSIRSLPTLVISYYYGIYG